jgi:hypothetical protein
MCGVQAQNDMMRRAEKAVIALIKNQTGITQNEFLVKNGRQAAWAMYTIQDDTLNIVLVLVKSDFDSNASEKELIMQLLEKTQNLDVIRIIRRLPSDENDLIEIYKDLGFEESKSRIPDKIELIKTLEYK